jgi:prepilin-type N-terminal cleavage/methylation domain-containing protein
MTISSVRKYTSGFTLAELAIATAIFAIAATGILSVFISSAAISESAGDITSMINLAREEIEDSIKGTQFDNLGNYNKVFPNIPADTSLACYVSNHPAIANLKQATVVICYRGRSNRVIGEDSNLNGVMDSGEDLDNNGRLSSLSEVTYFIGRN